LLPATLLAITITTFVAVTVAHQRQEKMMQQDPLLPLQSLVLVSLLAPWLAAMDPSTTSSSLLPSLLRLPLCPIVAFLQSPRSVAHCVIVVHRRHHQTPSPTLTIKRHHPVLPPTAIIASI
jgi:hypothetical protein